VPNPFYMIKRYAFVVIDQSMDDYVKRYIEYYTAMAIATPKWADRSEINKVYNEMSKQRKMGKDVSVDHTIPLSSKYVCGLNVHYNLKIMDRKKNIKKLNRWWPDMWNIQQDLPLNCCLNYQLKLF
jgi:hypothetical protein